MYNNDIGPSQIIYDETSDDRQQEKIIKKNINPGILKNSDHPNSRGDFDIIPSISRERLIIDEILHSEAKNKVNDPKKPLSLKLDAESENERVINSFQTL